MNKLKTTLLRTHISKHAEERRSQQFAKRLSAAHQASIIDDDRIHKEPPPRVELDELSDRERPAYRSWWKDLDPFNIGRLDNAAVLKFLTGFGLAEYKLEQILALFKDCVDGIDELQFYAILRLVAHAQNGRSVSREMVYLGAPVPHSQTNAIDALIKPAMTTNSSANFTPQQQMAMATRASDPSGSLGFDAWQKQQQQQQQQQQQPRPSWMGTDQHMQPRPTSWYFGQTQYQASNVVPSAPFLSPIATSSQAHASDSNPVAINTHLLFDQQQENINNAFPQTFDTPRRSSELGTPYATMNNNNNHRLSWAQQPQSLSSTTAEAIAKNEQKATHGHSRSRSVPYAVPSDTPTDQAGGFMFDTVGATTEKQQSNHRPSPLPSRVSMDADSFQRLSSAIDTGQSLLLTKKFVPPKASNNPFESGIEDSPRTDNASANISHNHSPFADESDNASLEASAPPWPNINDRPNKDNVYPPPVPPQSTKPLYLKYARNWFDQNNVMLRRTHSYGTSHKTNKPHPADPFNNVISADNIPATKGAKLFGSPTDSSSVRLFRHRSDGSSLATRR